MLVDGHQIRMARAGIGMTVKELAHAAGISPNTISRMESGAPSIVATIQAAQRALEEAGAVFQEDGSVLIPKEVVDRRKP